MILEFLATIFGAAYWGGKYVSGKIDKSLRSFDEKQKDEKYRTEYEPHFATEEDEQRVAKLISSGECFDVVGKDFEAVVGPDYMEKYREYQKDKWPLKDRYGHRYNGWISNLILAREGKIPREFNRYYYNPDPGSLSKGHRVSSIAAKEDVAFCELLEEILNENGIHVVFEFIFDPYRSIRASDKRVVKLADSRWVNSIPDYCLPYGNICLDTESFEVSNRLW